MDAIFDAAIISELITGVTGVLVLFVEVYLILLASKYVMRALLRS
jgi:hypothetical protein